MKKTKTRPRRQRRSRLAPRPDDNVLERMRAAKRLIDAWNDEDLKLAAFMAIFHGRQMTRTEVRAMRGCG